MRKPSYVRLMVSKDVRCLGCLGDVENGPVTDPPQEAIGSFEIGCAKNILTEYRSSGL